MPLFEAKKNNPNQTENWNLETKTNPPPNQTSTPKPSGLMTIIGQLLPLAPLAFEQFTGQKVPHMSGTMAEVQMALISMSTNLQVVTQRLTTLETKLTDTQTKLAEISTSANHHLTNLTQQFQSLRLTHTKERKQIEYNPPHNSEEPEY